MNKVEDAGHGKHRKLGGDGSRFYQGFYISGGTSLFRLPARNCPIFLRGLK